MTFSILYRIELTVTNGPFCQSLPPMWSFSILYRIELTVTSLRLRLRNTSMTFSILYRIELTVTVNTLR